VQGTTHRVFQDHCPSLCPTFLEKSTGPRCQLQLGLQSGAELGSRTPLRPPGDTREGKEKERSGLILATQFVAYCVRRDPKENPGRFPSRAGNLGSPWALLRLERGPAECWPRPHLQKAPLTSASQSLAATAARHTWSLRQRGEGSDWPRPRFPSHADELPLVTGAPHVEP
jgi:hypothetical protein